MKTSQNAKSREIYHIDSAPVWINGSRIELPIRMHPSGRYQSIIDLNPVDPWSPRGKRLELAIQHGLQKLPIGWHMTCQWSRRTVDIPTGKAFSNRVRLHLLGSPIAIHETAESAKNRFIQELASWVSNGMPTAVCRTPKQDAEEEQKFERLPWKLCLHLPIDHRLSLPDLRQQEKTVVQALHQVPFETDYLIQWERLDKREQRHACRSLLRQQRQKSLAWLPVHWLAEDLEFCRAVRQEERQIGQGGIWIESRAEDRQGIEYQEGEIRKALAWWKNAGKYRSITYRGAEQERKGKKATQKRLLDSHAVAACFPTVLPWEGKTQDERQGSSVLFPTRDHTPFCFPLAAMTSPTLVFGPSGSGKTRLLQLLAAQYLAKPGAEVYVLTKAKDWNRLCHALDGRIVDLQQEPGTLAPFLDEAIRSGRIDSWVVSDWFAEWVRMPHRTLYQELSQAKETGISLAVWASEQLKDSPVKNRLLQIANGSSTNEPLARRPGMTVLQAPQNDDTSDFILQIALRWLADQVRENCNTSPILVVVDDAFLRDEGVCPSVYRWLEGRCPTLVAKQWIEPYSFAEVQNDFRFTVYLRLPLSYCAELQKRKCMTDHETDTVSRLRKREGFAKMEDGSQVFSFDYPEEINELFCPAEM